MVAKLLIFFIIVIIAMVMTLFSLQGYATHTSKPVIITKNRTFFENERIIIKGWVDYFGHPVSDVSLDVMLMKQDGTIILRHILKSDPEGYFLVDLKPPNLKPGYYDLNIISECRIEHREICTNEDISVPLTIVQNHSTFGVVNASNANKFESDNAKSISENTSQQMSSISNHSTSFQAGDENNKCDLKFITVMDYILQLSNSNKIIHNLSSNARNGNLVVCNGSDNHDTLYSSNGNDIIGTFADRTIIDGEDGNDILINLGNSSNLLYGSNGNDIIFDAGHGNNTIYGGIGNDIIFSSGDNNVIHGGYGNDTIYDKGSNNSIYGDEGYDSIASIYGKSIMDGGSGFDICINGIDNFNCEQIKH